MLHLKFIDRMVDVVFYIELVKMRALFAASTDIGDTYRKRIGDPVIIALIDSWGQDLRAQLDQADDAEAVGAQITARLTEMILALIPARDLGAFVDKLAREKCSQQSAAEVQKFRPSPHFQMLNIVLSTMHGMTPPDEAADVVEKAALERISTTTQNPRLLDRRVTQVSLLPEALADMGQEVTESHILNRQWPWKLPPSGFAETYDPLIPEAPTSVLKALWFSAARRARRKARGQWEKEQKRENKEEPIDSIEDGSTASHRTEMVVLFNGEAQIQKTVWETRQERDDAIANRIKLWQKYEASKKEIRRKFRKDKAKKFFRFLDLYYEQEGELQQNEETAAQIEIDLRTLQTYIKEARKHGWIAKK